MQKKFLVLYRAPISAQEQMDSSTPEQRKAGMDMWMAWAGKVGDALVDFGSPLGNAVTVGGKAPAGFIGGYSIMRADDIGKARKLLDGHPHLMLQGASIDVMELLPTPGM